MSFIFVFPVEKYTNAVDKSTIVRLFHLPSLREGFKITYNGINKSASISVLSLTENTQRYKSLAGFAIYANACDISSMRYALRGVRGFISYRTEHSEVYRNRVKRGYIAFAQRIYRPTEKEIAFRLQTDLLSLSACAGVPRSECNELWGFAYMGLGLAHLYLTGQMRCSHLMVFSKFSVKNISRHACAFALCLF